MSSKRIGQSGKREKERQKIQKLGDFYNFEDITDSHFYSIKHRKRICLNKKILLKLILMSRTKLKGCCMSFAETS